MSKTLQELELENDKALIEFWKAVENERICKQALHETREFLALQIASSELDTAEAKMSAARKAYLIEKVKAAEDKLK
jgi:hypothetical protein